MLLLSPLSMEFSRQEYGSGLPFPFQGDLPNLGIKPTSFMSPALGGRFFTNSATWKTHIKLNTVLGLMLKVIFEIHFFGALCFFSWTREILLSFGLSPSFSFQSIGKLWCAWHVDDQFFLCSLILVCNRIKLLDQHAAKHFIQAWCLWGELLRSTLKHFADVFFSLTSAVRHFPSCASSFSHSSFEISTWGLATGWRALRFYAHHHAGFSRETFDIFLFFWAWVYCPTGWPLPLFFPSILWWSPMGFPFQQFSVLREALCLVCSVVFDFDSVASQLWLLQFESQCPRAWTIFLHFCLFLSSSVLTLFQT